MDVERLQEIKDRLGKATGGDWEVDQDGPDYGVTPILELSWHDSHLVPEALNLSDAEFIANAKADIEFLLGALVQAFEDGVNYEQSGQIWENSVYVDYDQPEPPYWLSVVE